MASETAIKGAAKPDSTRLAMDRTRLAYERTLMAWIRTSMSLISFGFTIYKFFQYIRENQQEQVQRLVGPRGYGIFMISAGLISLLFATVQHRQSMNRLRVYYPEAPGSLAAVLSAVISVLGILALLATIFRQ